MSKVLVIGSGLVGSLLAILMKKRGHDVTLAERRSDPRKAGYLGGRSINLALSDRGLRALEAAGIADEIAAVTIAMPGRMIHDEQGRTTFLPYGADGQAIRSVSRGGLNIRLLDLLDAMHIPVQYGWRCEDVRLAQTEAHFVDEQGNHHTLHADVILGCDGAYSATRMAMQRSDRFEYSQSFLQHGYKELSIAAEQGKALERHALHIWPRSAYMLMAMPNLEGSFTCTMYFPFEAPADQPTAPSFASLQEVGAARAFFSQSFPDALALMPDFDEQWRTNPVSSLVTIRCFPWSQPSSGGGTLILGDASHAIVPFFGQGMNAGFEDCRVLMELLAETNDDWHLTMKRFEQVRKPHADAIATLALENFVEMREKVKDPTFQLKKRVEAAVARACPERFIPSYTMVTFRPDLSYATALSRSRLQDAVLAELMTDPTICADPQSPQHAERYRALAQQLPPVVADL
jgi:kynurenine 3-monooxygenase